MTGTWTAAPDYAVVQDVTFAKSTDGKNVVTEIGKGAAIGLGPNMNAAMSRELIRLAEELDIPHQLEVLPGHSGTNAEEIQVSRMGVATALVSLPVRYMHSPVESLLPEDMESVRKLVVEFIAGMEG